MVRKPTSKTNKENEEVESPKTPESVGDTVTSPTSPTSPTFTPVEQEDATIWSSSFSWDMQTTSSEFEGSATTSNVWVEENKHSGQLDTTKKNEILKNKDDFEENVWTDVQVVAGMPNNQSIFGVPFTIPDSPTILKPQVEHVSTNSKNDESVPSHKEEVEVKEEGENSHKDSNEVANSETFDYVDLRKDNFSSSKELSKEFDEFTNSDIKLELNNNNEILYENKEFDDSFEQYGNEKSEKNAIEEEDDDDDFGAFERSEENESSFDDFGEFKSENTNDVDGYQRNENFSLDADDDFGDFEDSKKDNNIPKIDDDGIAQKILSPDLEHFMSVTNSVAGWISVLDKIYGLQISNESNDNERPVSIEDLVYNSHIMMNTSLNWNSFIKLWSDQGGIIKFSWRGSQIRKEFLECVNPISSIKTADRLPGSGLSNDDRTHDGKTKQDEENSTEELSINTNDNNSVCDVPKESIENNDNKQSTDSNRHSWITMSDISFLESFSSRQSSVSGTKKSQRKSETLFEDFLDTKTSPTSPVNNNSRIDSVMAKISRNSINLSAKLGSLKSHVFGGSNDILIPVEKNPSPTSAKRPVSVNLLDDSTIISKKTNEKRNSDGLHVTSEFRDVNDSSQQSLSEMNTKLNNDDLSNPKKTLALDDKKNDSTLPLEIDNDNDTNKLENPKQQDNWISSTDFSFLESFTNNSKPSSSSNSRKSQQNTFFDLSEFDSNPSSNIQLPKTSETFLQSMLNKENVKITNDASKHENQPKNIFNSDSKQLYTSSMNISSTSISSEFGEMVSANDTKNQDLQDDWMLNTSANQDNWISNSGLSFLETLKTSPNNHKSKQSFGDLDEFIF